jgi:putative oxidoreductase
MNAPVSLIARLLMAFIFIMAGLNKIGAGYAGTQGYMEAHGIPGLVLPLVILLELGGGILIAVGWQTRWAAWALAAFTLAAAVIFHNKFGDQMQMILFMKNLAITGGLLLLAIHGPGRLSVDRR